MADESYVRSPRRGEEGTSQRQPTNYDNSTRVMFFHHVPQSGYTTWTQSWPHGSGIHATFIQAGLGARFRVYCQLAARIFLPPPPLLYSIYSSRTRDERDARCLSRRWLCVKGIKSLSRSRLIYHAINVRARKSLAVRAQTLAWA